jgi:hypothetical protein
MRTPYVCTAPTTHGRIVTSHPLAVGASSPRTRGDEYPFISSVGTNHHRRAMNFHGSKMFTLLPQVLDLTLINLIYSLTAGSKVPIKNHCGPLQRFIIHKPSWSAHQTLDYRRLSKIIGSENKLFYLVQSPRGAKPLAAAH